MDREVIRTFWHARAGTGSTRWTDASFLAFEQQLLAGVLSPAARILDLGSGFGELSRSVCPPDGSLLAVDQEPTFSSAFSDDPRFEFVVGDVSSFVPSEKFDATLLFGVISYLPLEEEVRVYASIAASLRSDGVAVIKNQCSDDREFEVDTYSGPLQSRYVARYPAIEAQASRLAEWFRAVDVRPYPPELKIHPNSTHVAFVCSEPLVRP